MVRWFKYTRAFFRLIRFRNLLIIAATMYLLRWFVVLPVLNATAFIPTLNTLYFNLLVLATLCIAGGGYVINDYFDRKADLINRPGRVILGRILSQRTGMVWHIVLNIVGVALGLLVAYKAGSLKLGIIFILMSGLLWFYSTTYKQQVLLGNVMVAFMVASVPLLIVLFELPSLLNRYRYFLQADSANLNVMVAWIGVYAAFAFLLTLVREIVKDIEDFEGDFAFGRQTIPIAWGPGTARTIVILLTSISLLLVLAAMALYLSGIVSILYTIIAVLLPLGFFLFVFYKAAGKNDYHRASFLLKITMLGGLGYIVVARFFVFYF